MLLLAPGVIETLLLALAVVAAAAVRPWRLLERGSRYRLGWPLLGLSLALPALWWSPQDDYAALFSLTGAQLALLVLGWPLAMLLFAGAAAAGVLLGAAGWSEAVQAASWYGVIPVTLALAAGHALRRLLGPHVLVYLLGRAFLVPLAIGLLAAAAAHGAAGLHGGFGADVVPALLLTVLMDAMLTGLVVTTLVASHPRSVATWSDRLYLAQGPIRRSRLRP